MAFTDPLDALEAVIRSRRGADAASSYTASLFAKGRAKIAQKLGEEAVEAAIAAVQGDRAGLKGEAADVLFHLLVVLVDGGLTLDDIRTELAKREGVSGLVEKAARPKVAVVDEAATAPSSPLPLAGGVGGGPIREIPRAEDRGQPHPLPLPQAGGER